MTSDRESKPSKGSVVLVARHYPPAVSGGTRRAALLASGLRRRGWRVRVASPQAPQDEVDWIESPHPAALRAELALSREGSVPARLITPLRNAARRVVYWPDADMRWAQRTARLVEAAIVSDRPDWIVTSSPPESAHLVGAFLKRRTGVAWLAELRDSWVDDPLREELRSSSARRSIERRLAKRLLRDADHLVAVSDAIAAEIAGFGTSRPISIIGHFAEPSATSHAFDGTGPHLVHTGQFSLSHPLRTLRPVLDAFQRALASHPSATLHLVGRLTRDEVELATQHPARPRIRLYGTLPYAESRSFQSGADGLILYQPDTAALPGKISEYLSCSAPILTVGSGQWLDRMHGLPHWPLEALSAALAAGPRTPVDLSEAALDRYEALFAQPTIAQRGGPI